MLTNAMKYVSIVILVLAAVIWGYTAVYERVLGFIVATGAVLVAIQATRARKYRWVAAFYAVAIAFNPIVPLRAFSGTFGFALIVAAFVLFTLSTRTLKTQPLMSMPSIADRNPGSRSFRTAFVPTFNRLYRA